MVELRDHTKRLLTWQALLAAGREDSLNKKMLLCASLKIRHLIIKHFFLRFFYPSFIGRVFPITLL